MTRNNLIWLIFCLWAKGVFAQAPPQGINYQAVLYDTETTSMPGIDVNNLILTNHEFGIRFIIITGAPNGMVVYEEEHSTVTDEQGLFDLVIGQGAPLSGLAFQDIDWGSGLHYLQVQIDKQNSGNFVQVSTQQFWSVPYALYALNGVGSGIQNIVENDDQSLTILYSNGDSTLIGPLGWGLQGNFNTTDAINFIGTTNATGMVVKTNDSTRIYISENGAVGIHTTTIDPSAVFEIQSQEKGFLPPRLTRAERDSIPNPAAGLLLFNTSDSIMEYFNGTCWLPTFFQTCDDCIFDLSLPENSGNIDRVFSDSISIDINVTQTAGFSTTISFFALENLPPLTSYYFTNDTINGSGSTQLIVTTSIFDEPGLYPIAVQAICGNTIRVATYFLTIDSCYRVTIDTTHFNYDLQSYNNLPGPGTPICVVVDVPYTGKLRSTTNIQASYTSGDLDIQTHVGIRNYGAFLGRGGNGGEGGNFSTYGEPGESGGTAINLTTKTSILNYGYIFGGGGGGASVGLSQSFNIPFIGTWTLAIGAGGGGGCELGAGGGTGGGIIGFWDNGTSATALLYAVPGNGGTINLPITIPLGVASITITPDVVGGDGGDYGLPGTSGQLEIQVSATVPLLGTINIPTPPITNFPPGGNAGYAILRNNQDLIGLPNGNYQLNNLKGIIND
jgi:hypothetical protein